MKKSLLLLSVLILLSFSSIIGQSIDTFSVLPNVYIEQLKDHLKSVKHPDLDNTFDKYKELIKNNQFEPDEFLLIIDISNKMLEERISVKPGFYNFMNALISIKNNSVEKDKFIEWLLISKKVADNSTKLKNEGLVYFFEFSKYFYKNKTIRFSKNGIIWRFEGDKFDLKFDEKNKDIYVTLSDVNLLAQRKNDSIFINNTSGVFSVSKNIFTGTKGEVNWTRVNLPKDVKCELQSFKINTKKGMYTADSVLFQLPDFFGTKKLLGRFKDKLQNVSNESNITFPLFESYEKRIKIDNIGEGVEYIGGFRLEGSILYGYGNKDEPAVILISQNGVLKFRGQSTLFTIKKDKSIFGQGVNSSIYFDQDSIFHPSLNFRYNYKSKEIKLERGTRGRDQNPFYNSYQNLNIYGQNLIYELEKDSIVFGKKIPGIGKSKNTVKIQSPDYFNVSEFERFQNVSHNNPIVVLKVLASKLETNLISTEEYAKKINPKFNTKKIERLLYDLVSHGFIEYLEDENMIKVHKKVFLYSDASRKKVDFDVFKIISDTKEDNAVFDLSTKTMAVNEANKFQFSKINNVAAIPNNKKVVMGKNRDMDFDGKLFAGRSMFYGEGFHFNYEKFNIKMDSVSYFDLYLPNGNIDIKGNPELVSIGSRIENLNGYLIIDAPNNKSSKIKLDGFPSFHTKKNTYVFYDSKSILNGIYSRDSFYFELDLFDINGLNDLTREDVKFSGKMISAEIFQPFVENITLQGEEDILGFVHPTSESGDGVYKDRANFNGNVSLNIHGLTGIGTLKYLNSEFFSEDIIFKPKELLANAKTFDVKERKTPKPQTPKAHGEDVHLKWIPQHDTMYVWTDEKPFSIFSAEKHKLHGQLILTSDGVKGNGELKWEDGQLSSKLMLFKTNQIDADTASLLINALESDEIAFDTKNVKLTLDFERKHGRFKSNQNVANTYMPYLQYITSSNEFEWNMEDYKILFNASKAYPSRFISVHPNQDSLSFTATSAIYNIKTSQLDLTGIEKIFSGGAYIYPNDKTISIEPPAQMQKFKNARIITDTINKFHIINKATVQILGKKLFNASGFYEYNIGDKNQEIWLEEIIGQRVGKGKRSKKRLETRATGEVKEEDDFYIDHTIRFQGQIGLKSSNKNLSFDGFAQLNASSIKNKEWFKVSFAGDKSNMYINYVYPKNFKGYKLYTGIYLNRDENLLYPRVLQQKYDGMDRKILDITGLFRYNPKEDEYSFGDSLKISGLSNHGSILKFSNRQKSIKAEGLLNICEKLDMVKIDAAGLLESNMIPDSTSETIYHIDANILAGIDFYLPPSLMDILKTDIGAASFNELDISPRKDRAFYLSTLAQFIEKDKNYLPIAAKIENNILDIPTKYSNYTFFFGNLNMKWNSELQAFISSTNQADLISIGKKPIRKKLECYVQFKMPYNDLDRFYIYLKTKSKTYYFFAYKQGILSVVTNNIKFMDVLINLKKKESTKKMGKGKVFIVQPINPGSAAEFVQFMKETAGITD